MNKLIKLFAVLSGVASLSGCADDMNYSRDYYSSNGGVTTYQSEVTSGYNRDYQARKPTPDNSAYSSTESSTASNTGGGYSSTGSM